MKQPTTTKTSQRQKKMEKPQLEAINFYYKFLKKELQRLKQRTSIGYEVTVKWLPGALKYHNGRQLAEEVVGNTIFIYTEDPQKALKLVRHGFAEWILNQHTKPYRQLINKLITLFEEQQYERKEKIIESLTNLFEKITLTDSQKDVHNARKR